MRTPDQKICVIGFQKTGTTTLETVLERLGYSVGYAADKINRKLDDLAGPKADETVTQIALQILA